MEQRELSKTCFDLAESQQGKTEGQAPVSEQEQMKMDMVKNLALLLIEQDSTLTMEQALSIVFNSDTYQKLMIDDTRLYYQSPRYVFSFLDNELKIGKLI